MPELTMVRCDRYACKLLLATCVAKWKQSINANPGVKGSECAAGCEQGRERAGLGQVASGGEDDLTSVNEGSLGTQKPDQAPVVTRTTAPTHRNIALDSGLPICPNCGEEFEPNPFTTTEQIYCSRRCGKQAWAKVHRPGKSAKKRMSMANIKRASTPSTATSVATDSVNVATKDAITAHNDPFAAPKELRLVQPVVDKLPPVDALPIGYVAKAIMYVLTEFPNLRLLPTYTPGDVCGGSSAGGGKGNGDPGRQVN